VKSISSNQSLDIADPKRKTESKLGFTHSLIVATMAAFVAVIPMFATEPADASVYNSGSTPSSSRISAGNHAIFLGSDGKIYSWGKNDNGQLGIGNTENTSSPVAVSTASFPAFTYSAIAAGSHHSLALSSNGKLYSWGKNDNGQLGIGNTDAKSAPVAISTASFPANSTFSAIAGGSGHSLALSSNGKLYSWGKNAYGRLGIGNTDAKSAPVAISTASFPANSTFSAIAAGGAHSLAISSKGDLYSWGRGGQGQLGTGNNDDTSSPVAVSTESFSGSTFSAIAAGGFHSIALTSDGKLYTWGNNGGNNDNYSSPYEMNFATLTFSAIAAGFYHSIALGSDGKIYSWGKNDNGQLGIGVFSYFDDDIGPIDNDKPSLSAVSTASFPANATFSAIGAGVRHSIALSSAGSLYSWGLNTSGQLGRDTSVADSNPVPALLLLPLLTPTFASPTATSDGFTVQISNYDANYTWTVNATDGGSVAISGTGLITVTGVAASVNSTVTITAARGGYGTGSSNVAESSLDSTPAESAPAPYSGPLPTGVSKKSMFMGQAITISGQRLESITSVKIDGLLAVVSNQSATAITITIPSGLEVGFKDLEMISKYGALTYLDVIEIIQMPEESSAVDAPLEDNAAPSTSATPASSQKLNAGSFKGYVAIYAKGYEGKRLSAKVAGKWLKISSLGSDFERILLPTGAGYEIKIDLYIDAVLLEQIEITTR
jgi:alpha-tubulin suppressor-like RCC1 family protein